MDSKVWYLSKTLWVFGLLFVVAVLNLVGVTNLELSADAQWLSTTLTFIAFILRLITGQAVTLWKKTE